MTYIIVSPLKNIGDAAKIHGPHEMISLMGPIQNFDRPDIIRQDRHLIVRINDINVEMQGLVYPEESHVSNIIEFARSWDQKKPLLIHCWFGISRSPAAALISALANRPDQDDFELAYRLREASACATPNQRIIEIGDTLLGRNGRLCRAVNAIGRGKEASQGIPFTLQPI
ncbi:MAG: tyrosine phosphatase family protein [Halioglobus sp.]|nr:tyrosine phosphatase family protein [Halioglobus sp.]